MTKHARKMPDMEETKEHIISAGRELMLAADGALRFCRAYAESCSSPASRSHLVSFFTRAIDVADELAKGLITASGKEAVRKAASPVFDALGREMARESRAEKAPGRRRKKAVKRAAGRPRTGTGRRPCHSRTQRS